MARKRGYRLQKRAQGVADTRQRIIEAVVELHRTAGPAETSVTDVARRAGVSRITVYEHFPDEAALFTACAAHWRGLHPAPNPDEWSKVRDAGGRRRRVLRDLYGWYRETEPMTANVLRDAERSSALRAIIDRGLGTYQSRVQKLVAGALRGARVVAAARAATDFHFWCAVSALGDAEAAEVAASFVEMTAKTRRPR